ncbi:MAG: helix-turn-helix transcriptional regulator [Gammaproteobacteria bacterium]|nr:helix-turn-helix transcriptional regulator [Gammaproteobacteria bacterium]
METKYVVAALGALAQATRLEIYRRLVVAGAQGLAVGQIAEYVATAPATLSFHLKELVHAGLIEPRQEGRFIYYCANYATMNELLGFLTENCCAGDGGSCARASCTPAMVAKKTTKKKPSVKRRVVRR